MKTKQTEIRPETILNVGKIIGYLVKNQTKVMSETSMSKADFAATQTFLHKIVSDVDFD